MKIPFDIKFRPQIESGEYKVETKSGNPIRVLAWDLPYDFPIATAEFTKDNRVIVESYSVDGWVGYGEKENNLFIITPEPELTEFEQEVRVCVTKNLTTHIKDGNGSEMSCTVFIDDDTAKKIAAELLVLAKKELCKDCVPSIEGYTKGRQDAFKEMEKDRVYKHEGPTPHTWFSS